MRQPGIFSSAAQSKYMDFHTFPALTSLVETQGKNSGVVIMEKFQILFMICFGFLSVYNFIRDSEIHRQVGELVETRQGGMKFFSVSIPRTHDATQYYFFSCFGIYQ